MASSARLEIADWWMARPPAALALCFTLSLLAAALPPGVECPAGFKENENGLCIKPAGPAPPPAPPPASLLEAAMRGDMAAAREFVAASAAAVPRAVDPLTGKTALHHAARGGPAELVELLLKEKADPTAADKDGQQPIHLAVPHGQREAAELLVAAGASVNAPVRGSTLLHFAAFGGKEEGLQLLLELGADVGA